MSNITFTCPHCSHTTKLASSTEGMKGNCPSCKTEVVITSANLESEWLVMSSGLKGETPTRLNDSEIIALIRDETIAGGAQLSNLSKSIGQWITLKDSHFSHYVDAAKEKKLQMRESKKEEKLALKSLLKRKKERAEEKQRQTKKREIAARKNRRREDLENRTRQVVIHTPEQIQDFTKGVIGCLMLAAIVGIVMLDLLGII
jgi:hypothetical protein